ncbi:hypothetical protein BT67DRAFT_277894 [Trichocladium antarcticum]|uniref:Uncharacterized protein n=1 Tax=Trichocladium antarcticum TaxID=1450529 RepID=A0AAN6UMM5_9PEZI|nr:hypothetical protein BT67DRAFT_277894 [Trichocladium antarcticum]
MAAVVVVLPGTAPCYVNGSLLSSVAVSHRLRDNIDAKARCNGRTLEKQALARGPMTRWPLVSRRRFPIPGRPHHHRLTAHRDSHPVVTRSFSLPQVYCVSIVMCVFSSLGLGTCLSHCGPSIPRPVFLCPASAGGPSRTGSTCVMQRRLTFPLAIGRPVTLLRACPFRWSVGMSGGGGLPREDIVEGGGERGREWL